MPTGCPIEDEISAPDMAGTLNAESGTGVDRTPCGSFFLPLSSHFQPFCLPNSVHTLEIHSKSLQSEQSCHLSIAESRTGQLMQSLANDLFVFSCSTPISDAASRKINTTTGPTLRHRKLISQPFYGLAFLSRA
jgi:hypothetical protein